MPGDTHSQNGTYNTSFFQLHWLVSSTFQINKQDPISHIQSTEFNKTTVSKQSNPKLYNSGNAAILVLFTFDSTKSDETMYGERYF